MNQKRWTAAYIEQQLANDLQAERRRQGFDSDSLPSYVWLNANGYSGLHRAAKREYGKSTHEVLIEICGFRDPSVPSHFWPGEHTTTHDLLERYIDSLKQRKNQAHTTVNGTRSRLKTLLHYHQEVTGHGDLIKTANGRPATGYQIIRAVFDLLHSRHTNEDSKLNYSNNLINFYDWAKREGHVDHNPAEKAVKDFGWTYSSAGDPSPLSVNQMRQLWLTAETIAEQTLLVVFGGAGGRPLDIVRMNTRSELQLDDPDPRIEFEERKNGPGTVAIMAGIDVLQAHIENLQEQDEWNGKLFPSDRSASGSRTPETLRNWLKDIAERADVRLDDDRLPTPRNLRQFWYEQYTTAVAQWLAAAKHAADAQGSSSAKVVVGHYLSGEATREHFRTLAGQQFEAAFPSEHSLVSVPASPSIRTQHTLEEWASSTSP